MTLTPQICVRRQLSFEQHQTNYVNVKEQKTGKTFHMEKLNVTYLRKAGGKELNKFK